MADIAVVIPCFNLGAFVGEAVESAVRQTRSAAEIVVVDDGSTDLRTCQVLAQLDVPGVKVLRTPNRGVSAARNYGIQLTSAPYIVTLDADDRLKPTYFERTACVLDEAPGVAFVSTAIQTFGDAAYEWTPPVPSMASALTRGTPHPATMFRREVWHSVGGFNESPGVQGCEDLDFWLTAIERGHRGQVLAEALLEYRLRSDSVHQRLVADGRQADVVAAVLRCHAAAIAAIGTTLLVDKERFIEDQRAHGMALRRRQAELTRVLGDIDRQIDAALDRLSECGAWGNVDNVRPFASMHPVSLAVSLYETYVREFLDEYYPNDVPAALFIGESALATSALQWTRENTVPPARIEQLCFRELYTFDEASLDCVVAVDVLQREPNPSGVLGAMARVLRPGGALLCVLPAVCRTDEIHPDQDLWRFTEAAARHLLSETFPPHAFELRGYGNVLTCAASLAGVDARALAAEDRDTVDPMFPVLYGVRAVKS